MRHGDSTPAHSLASLHGPWAELCASLASADSEAAVFSALTAAAIRHAGFERAAVVRRRPSGGLAVEAAMGFSPHFRAWIQAGDRPGSEQLFHPEAVEWWDLRNAGPSAACRTALGAEGIRGVGAYPIPTRLSPAAWLLGACDEPRAGDAGGRGDLAVMLTLAGAAVDRQHALHERASHMAVVKEMGAACFERVRQGEWLYRGVSPELAQMLGQAAADLESGRVTAAGIKHPGDRDRCAFEIGRCVASREMRYSTEYRVIRADGSTARIREHGRVMEVDAEGAVRILGVMAPAEQPQATPTTAPEAIVPVFRQFPFPLCDVDLDGRLIRSNEQFRNLVGAGMDAPAGALIDEFLHADDLPRHRGMWAEVISGRTPLFQTTHRWRRPDGTFTPMQTLGVATTYLADSRPLVRFILLDGGEVTRLRDEVRQHRAKLQSYFEQAAVGMAELGQDGKFISMNPRYAEMLGYRRDELVGKDWRMVSHPEDTIRCESKIAEISAGSSPEFTLEKRYVRRDGSIMWAIVSLSRVCDAEGRLDRFVAVMYDVSDRRRLQEHLAELGTDRANTPGRVLRVLVADDEPSVLSTVCAMLAFNAFESSTATTLAEARAALRSGEPYDVVLCDLGLGGGDEAALLRELEAAAPSTRAVLMTGDAPGTEGSTVLCKPFSVEQLTAAILDAAGVRSAKAP